MLWCRDISIRQKLQAIVMVTGAAALMIGSNSTAGLAFDDPGSAREILAALLAKQQVINACIYDSDGTVFAHFDFELDAAFCGCKPEETTQPKITCFNLRIAT